MGASEEEDEEEAVELFDGWGIFEFYNMFTWVGFWEYVKDAMWLDMIYLPAPVVMPTIYLFRMASGKMKWK